MEGLKSQDHRALLDFLRGVYATTSLDAFARQVAGDLGSVVACDIGTYTEINHKLRRVMWVYHGVDRLFPDADRAFAEHMHEHPLVTDLRGRGAMKVTDFMSLRDWRRRGIYNEFYRRLGITNVMAVLAPTPPSITAGIVVLRAACEFTERERLLLNLLHPHLAQAYLNAEAADAQASELALLDQGVADLGGAAIVLAADDRVRLISAQARQWLAEYFEAVPAQSTVLPEEVALWVRRNSAPSSDAGALPALRSPLVAKREDRRLVLRLLGEGERRMVLLKEEVTAPQAGDLAALGLTRRESEVLMWVAAGKSNAIVAAILDLSPRTVQHTLERIYRKLGVGTRVAATACALRAGLRLPEAP